jgi:hypothetical protein
MSTGYIAIAGVGADKLSLANIRAADLFDGRLEAFGIYEHFNEETNEADRMLTDGRNYLWVKVEGGLVSAFVRYASNGAPGKILGAIADAFDVDIVSEYQPQFWGFKTQEEWDTQMEELSQEAWERFHAEIVKFLKGEPHDIRPGTVGMGHAQIAKKLVEEDPALLLPENKSKFRDAIYNRDGPVSFTVSPEDRALVEMMATHDDDLPFG